MSYYGPGGFRVRPSRKREGDFYNTFQALLSGELVTALDVFQTEARHGTSDPHQSQQNQHCLYGED